MAHLIGGFGKSACLFLQNRLSGDRLPTISDDGLFCFVADFDAHTDNIPVGDKAGVILGKVFDKKSYEPIKSFTQNLDPHTLINSYWGRYVAAIYNKNTSSLSLVRDPLGLSTLYYMPYEDGALFASSLSQLIGLLETKPSLDLDYFAEFLLEKNYLVAETPFQGVYELLPGMHITFQGNKVASEKFEWDIPTDKLFNEAEIEEKIFESLKNSTQAWVQDAQKITLQLSGGVDSSSVLCMLRHINSGAMVQAMHLNDSKHLASQEIEYAKQIAQECEVPLTIFDYHGARLFDPLPVHWRPDKPSTGMFFNTISRQAKQLCKGGMSLSGQGGDHVFLAPPPEESIADYLLAHGPFGVSSIFSQLSSMFRTSWISLAKINAEALKRYVLSRSSQNITIPIFYDMLGQEYKKKSALRPFYLDEILKKFPPAKANQIRNLYHAVAYLDSTEADEVVTYPLLSLPVVEEALKIPTYMSMKDGYNRYFLRKAVSRISPTRVIWRRNKGEVSASIIKTLQNELATIVDLVGSGVLLRHRVLDRAWFDHQCDKVRYGDASYLMPLLRVIGTELWLRQWGYR